MTLEGNRYAPPAASVADLTSARPAKRPREVTRAVRLFWVVLVLRLLNFQLSAVVIGGADTEVPASVLWGFVAISSLVVVGFSAWIFVKVASGRNWARVICLLLTVVNFAAAAYSEWQTVAASLATQQALLTISGMVVDAVATVLDFYALFLLFTKAAAPWFAPPADARVDQ